MKVKALVMTMAVLILIYCGSSFATVPGDVNNLNVWHTGISLTRINVRGNPVAVGQLTINASTAGKVLAHFNGACIPSNGDRIVLAASNQVDWVVNDGNVSVISNKGNFSHTRMYDIAQGSHTFYAVAQNYVDESGSGIASIYGSLSVEFFPGSTSTSSVAVSFASLGLWVYKSDIATWTQLSSVNPENMIYSGSTLYVDFGASHGLYKWDGTAWSQLTSANPENMVTSGSALYVNFGASYGLYKWDGAAWSQLTSANPENMVTSGSALYVNFGASYGLWKWDGSSWSQLTGSNPDKMAVPN
jgi:hypothetical protein